MRKTLALLLAVAFLSLLPSAPPIIKSQTLVAASKFYRVANPIPNRYIVVLATTDLSPIADSGPSTKQQLHRALRLQPLPRSLPIRVRCPLLQRQSLPIRRWLQQRRT